jgi:hypothetical protein
MKVTGLIAVIFSLLVFSTISAKNINSPADDEEVKQAVENYSKGIDNRDVDMLGKVIYSKAHFVNYNKITNEVVEVDNKSLVNMVSKGKAGGWSRDLNISSVDVNDNTAVAKVEMKDAKLKQSGFLTLIKENGSWKIANGVTVLESIK